MPSIPFDSQMSSNRAAATDSMIDRHRAPTSSGGMAFTQMPRMQSRAHQALLKHGVDILQGQNRAFTQMALRSATPQLTDKRPLAPQVFHPPEDLKFQRRPELDVKRPQTRMTLFADTQGNRI